MYQSADYIYSAAKSVTTDEVSDRIISDLEIFWNTNKKFIALSVSFQDIDQIDDLISNLRSAYDSSNKDELEKVKRMLCNSSGLLTRYERFRLENVL
jgi:hypothetical protein